MDDNATNRRILVAQTAKWGMVPRETGSPSEALRWLKDGEQFDIILSDLLMPEMDGVEFASRATQADGAAASPPIVILSSVGVRDRDETKLAGWLAKPVKPSGAPRHDRDDPARRRRVPALAGARRPTARQRRWASGIRCASCWPRTTR